MGVVTATAPGSYEMPAYVEAHAEHARAQIEIIDAGGASLPILRLGDGSLHTVYGLPRPFGVTDEEHMSLLADQLTDLGAPVTAILSPLEPGPGFASLLCERGGAVVGERSICIADVSGGDPLETVERRALRSIQAAQNRGGWTQVSEMRPWFPELYRTAMKHLNADREYFFADRYFERLASTPHFQITVRNGDETAAAVLFLYDHEAAYYHLGGRGSGDLRGAMSLALGEGLREAWRRGCDVAVLGGGLSDRLDDSLFTFKRQLAATVLPRITVTVGRPG